jgi:D-sedoheptulose 7-phosphate isomerase
LESIFRNNIGHLKKSIISIDDDHMTSICKCIQLTRETILSGKKLMLCGNGGSAATASHITNDLLCHMKNWDRKGYPVLSLNDSPVILTSLTNDYGYDQVFVKQIRALGEPEDMLWAFSTSGNSENIIKAVEEAKQHNIITIVFTGRDGGKLKTMCDVWIRVNSDEVMRIEELHLIYAHCIAESVEALVSPIKES